MKDSQGRAQEPDYVMKIMATGGVLAEDETCRVTYRGSGDDRTTFHYKKPFDWHFRYRHAVDDHNNLRHALPSLEDTWIKEKYPTVPTVTYIKHSGALIERMAATGIDVVSLDWTVDMAEGRDRIASGRAKARLSGRGGVQGN
eukprot:CCRYP_016698-RA/>CCRYP_016698-RA protein AED:0.43 eAED:0.33 QI:0/0/0/0.66/1/1/3/0/142